MSDALMMCSAWEGEIEWDETVSWKGFLGFSSVSAWMNWEWPQDSVPETWERRACELHYVSDWISASLARKLGRAAPTAVDTQQLTRGVHKQHRAR